MDLPQPHSPLTVSPREWCTTGGPGATGPGAQCGALPWASSLPSPPPGESTGSLAGSPHLWGWMVRCLLVTPEPGTAPAQDTPRCANVGPGAPGKYFSLELVSAPLS